jgi:hypothetical protein
MDIQIVLDLVNTEILRCKIEFQLLHIKKSGKIVVLYSTG